jgi:hypothetical protein
MPYWRQSNASEVSKVQNHPCAPDGRREHRDEKAIQRLK